MHIFLSHFKRKTKSSNISNININSESFQVDCFLPLLLCIPLILLSLELTRAKYGYKMKNQIINHFFYRNELKLYWKNASELGDFLNQAKIWLIGTVIPLGLDKCTQATLNLIQDWTKKAPHTSFSYKHRN